MQKVITYNKFIRKVMFLSIISILMLFLLYSNLIQSSSIEKNIKNDTNAIAKLIFQNIYTVMKMGGDIEVINETIKKIENSISHVNIAVLKNDENKNEIVTKAFQTKESQIISHKQALQFATPMLFKQECLQCHANSQINDVAGVIFIEHPIMDIKLSLEDIFMMISILFILIILVFFTTWIYFLKKYFIEPINSLISQISKHKTYKDLKSEIIIDTNIKEIKLLEKAFNTKNKALFSSSNKLELASNKDHLTGIHNRKKFVEYSTLMINDSQRYNHTFSLLLIDLNKFKPINDTYGHNIGDKVLIFFTQIINNSIRETDYLFRIGGDEFYLLLSNTSYDESTIIVKKLQEKLMDNQFISGNIKLEVSASFGIAQHKKDADTIEELIKIADIRMYENKKKENKIS